MSDHSHTDAPTQIRLVDQSSVERAKLDFEREKWIAEQRKHRKLWDGAPLNATVVVAVIGALVTVGSGYYQLQANRDLERTKYETQLILKALEPADSVERTKRLSFLIRSNLILNTSIKLDSLAGSPQFTPEGTRLSRPLVEGARVFVLAGTQRHLDGRPDLPVKLAQAGFQVLGVRPLVDETRPSSPEVRYFNTSDAAQADTIAAFLRRTYDLAVDRGMHYPDQSAKEGYIEIWLGR
jgi:hypothetical protein